MPHESHPALDAAPDLTVFLVDDDEDIRTSLSRALDRRGYSVECHASAQSFLSSYDANRRGCLVLDYGLPGMNGLELQQAMNDRGLTLPIIFITGHGGVRESVQAIKAGAVDFLEKPFRQSVLVERIETAFAQAIAAVPASRPAKPPPQLFDALTAREREIAERMLAQPSEISSKEIAAYLGISPRTVDHHRARILEKLRVRSVAELIALASR